MSSLKNNRHSFPQIRLVDIGAVRTKEHLIQKFASKQTRILPHCAHPNINFTCKRREKKRKEKDISYTN